MCNNTVTKDPTTPQMCRYTTSLPCEMSSVLKATIENKTTFVTTHFKEINKEQRVYCLSYCHFWGHPVGLDLHWHRSALSNNGVVDGKRRLPKYFLGGTPFPI